MLAPVPQHEYELQATLEYTFMKLGGQRPAYGSIVGSGQNGTQLHYMKDRGATKPGDVVVIDAATEYEGYAADITRTLPISGTFTAEQREDLSARARRAGGSGAEFEAGQVGGGGAGLVGCRTREGIGGARSRSKAKTRRSIRPGRRTASVSRRRAGKRCSG